MATETASGRQGKTVYLPAEMWNELTEIAADPQAEHPAFAHGQTRKGSVSSVIERIIETNRPTYVKLHDALDKIRDLERELANFRQMGPAALKAANEFHAQAAALEEQLRTIAILAGKK